MTSGLGVQGGDKCTRTEAKDRQKDVCLTSHDATMLEKVQEREISEKNWPLPTKTLRAEHRMVRSEMY